MRKRKGGSPEHAPLPPSSRWTLREDRGSETESSPTQTTLQRPARPFLPQFLHCAVDMELEPRGVGAVGVKSTTARKSKAIFFSLPERVACVKVKIKPAAGKEAGECFVWHSRLAVASVAENIGSGHACLLSNPITPCGWAPKIAPVSPISSVQRFHRWPLIVPPPTGASLTPAVPAGQGPLG